MERKIRLITGLTLFAYAASHFLGHATGLFGVAAMEAIGRNVILAPWQTPVARAALALSFLIHGGLGLRALYRRRHLKAPALETWQLGLGLLIPLALALHLVDVRVGNAAFGLDDTYYRILYAIWANGAALTQRERGRRAVRLTYPGGRVVAAPPGFSVLETSRWAGIPHASACGGRGRCSTCRVEILAGAAAMPAPLAAESETLVRVKAPPGVRLACQLRPIADITVAPLVAIVDPIVGLGIGDTESHERLVTALLIDLRDSTRFAAGRLPLDALFVIPPSSPPPPPPTAAHTRPLTNLT